MTFSSRISARKRSRGWQWHTASEAEILGAYVEYELEKQREKGERRSTYSWSIPPLCRSVWRRSEGNCSTAQHTESWPKMVNCEDSSAPLVFKEGTKTKRFRSDYNRKVKGVERHQTRHETANGDAPSFGISKLYSALGGWKKRDKGTEQSNWYHTQSIGTGSAAKFGSMHLEEWTIESEYFAVRLAGMSTPGLPFSSCAFFAQMERMEGHTHVGKWTIG